jgi:hypothetical protein
MANTLRDVNQQVCWIGLVWLEIERHMCVVLNSFCLGGMKITLRSRHGTGPLATVDKFTGIERWQSFFKRFVIRLNLVNFTSTISESRCSRRSDPLSFLLRAGLSDLGSLERVCFFYWEPCLFRRGISREGLPFLLRAFVFSDLGSLERVCFFYWEPCLFRKFLSFLLRALSFQTVDL